MGGRSPQLTLTLQDHQKAPEEVAGTIQDLAPKDNKYRGLYLQSWPGSDSSLNQLVAALAAAGVRTEGDGAERWTDNTYYRGTCRACGGIKHRLGGGRCVRLILPEDTPYDVDGRDKWDFEDTLTSDESSQWLCARLLQPFFKILH